MKKTALITGASSGIGMELAKIHAQKGGNLVVVARSTDTLQSLKTDLEHQHGINVTTITKDLTDAGASKEVYDTVRSNGIQVDYLINNAGFGGVGKFHERKWEQDLSMIRLNIIALTALTRHFLPDFVARNEGRILNVSSTAALVPGPLQAVYYATKAYVTSFSNAIAEELYDTDITVTALMPGATDTDFGKVSGMDKTELFKSTASAKSVAQDGYEAMLKGKLNVVSGLGFSQKVMMKLLPLLPKKMVLRQIREKQQTKD
ncbi:SDR family oxidoreductase [Allomuricauda sp. d1]|uniref:SDR family NAD(P)-dependent oxidoreductase n=1 Tax=Allomuricauda sp. d1 TaxID=3136725 RepID=UPI0031D074D1